MATTKVIKDLLASDSGWSTSSESGLRMPSINAAYSGPTAEEGMMRNEVGQVSESSASTMQHYNGTDWKNFVNVVQCTTATCDYPTTAKALYQLNDNANDTCGNYNGTETAITYAAGKYGNAAVFNGSNGKIIANGKPLNNNTSITISFWARNINSSDWKTLLGEGGDSGSTPGYKIYTSPPSIANSNYLWIARADNPTGYVFDTYDGSAANKGGVDMGVAGSAWVNCVFTVSPTQLFIYKNGVSVKSLSISNTSSVVGYYDFQFMYDAKYDRYLQGELDQVRLFDVTLTSDQVLKLYNEVVC